MDAVRDHRSGTDPDLIFENDIAVHNGSVPDETSGANLDIVRNKGAGYDPGFASNPRDLAKHARSDHGVGQHVCALFDEHAPGMRHLQKLAACARRLEADGTDGSAGVDDYSRPYGDAVLYD